ncbi:MAG: DNA-binding protein WhiA [Clostridia bacterium]|nr:DNA-binding protein WhiA [Clostridia bacterium]
MNFTQAIKSEIFSKDIKSNERKKSFLAGVLRGGILYERDGEIGIEFKLDNELGVQKISDYLLKVYNYEVREISYLKDNRFNKEKIVINLYGANTEDIIEDLKIIYDNNGIKSVNFSDFSDFIDDINSFKNFIQGLFISVGSCILPADNHSEKTGYHLELSFSHGEMASIISEKLLSNRINNKITRRKDRFILYVKSAEEIKDFLAFLGLSVSVFKITETMIEREIKNTSNRQKNCDLNNLNKQVEASAKQLSAIQIIKQKRGLSSLKKPLQEVAEKRLENPETSLIELAEILNISKSCLNHRLRKIIEIAKDLG